nr:MAG TPA: cysteine-rich protein [Bacteriophage sp.]
MGKIMGYTPKTIYCPRCNRRVGEWDGRSTTNVIVSSCKKCRKRIVYHVDTGKTEVSKMPLRNTSSGMTFL